VFLLFGEYGCFIRSFPGKALAVHFRFGAGSLCCFQAAFQEGAV